ncbi:MAG TPA: alpha/beta fold hydrolase, partial [bacterium]|nr:alpha/beta fold hydrolase [bacterium]
YIDEGTGDPVILVHGNPTWSFYYRNVVRKLRNDYRLIAPDHIGCGLSDKPRDAQYSYSLEQRIDDLAALIRNRIGSRPYRMIVHDWGGMIGIGVALRHPDRLRQLVVLNTAAFLLPSGRRFHGILKFARTVPGGFLIRYANAFVRGTLRWGSVAGTLNRTVRHCYLAPYDSPARRIAVQRFVQDIPLHPDHPAYRIARSIDDRLSDIASTPKLILWGARDFIFDDAFLTEWKRRFPDATVRVMENAGHLVLEDAPDVTADAIESFFKILRSHDSRSSEPSDPCDSRETRETAQ